MPLNEESQEVTWSPMHYIHVKKIGSFQQTAPAAWKELHQNLSHLIERFGHPHAFFSLYKVEPEMIYMAGVAVKKDDESIDLSTLPLPEGFEYLHFQGGKYLQFTLMGPYDQLPEACGRVFEVLKEKNVPVDPSVNGGDRFFIENYANNPSDTAPEDLITHICIPIP